MIHIIKNNKWAIVTSLIAIFFGVVTFLTFINRSFIELNAINLKILLYVDLFLVFAFFIFVFRATIKILHSRKQNKIGSDISSKYITFFSLSTLVPSIIIAIFSLFLFNVVLQQYFEKQIKSIVVNSSEVAKNYVEETKKNIDADILLALIDINRKANLFYEKPKKFLNILTNQRLLRNLDEIYILDSGANIIMSNVMNININFIPPTEEAFIKSLEGKPVRITDSNVNRTSALVKLNNFIDTYLYIVKFMDPKLIAYIQETDIAVDFYYNVQDQKSGIKITFAFIYVLVVSLLLFLSIIISINFSGRLTQPIINLIKASEKISDGDLNAKVSTEDSDKEFKKLNENFNSMIEKLKKQQDKLLLNERHLAWEDVARKLAHEIKNPLTPIQLSIDRIREKYLTKIEKDQDIFSSYLDTVNKQIKSIENLVTEFSNFARMPKPIFKKINLYDIISQCISLHEISFYKINFTLSGKQQILIKGDSEQLNRVFINLIKNSIESINYKTSKNAYFKGKITIEIEDDNDYIYIVFKDNGIGFDQIDKKKMLTPYFTTKKNGSGLGLAIVSKIITDHNSLIEFNSVDHGAEIKIIIPKNYV